MWTTPTTTTGVLISVSLTLQFNLFTEMPFHFEWPTVLFIITGVMCFGVAILSSLLPARNLLAIEISNVLKGRTEK